MSRYASRQRYDAADRRTLAYIFGTEAQQLAVLVSTPEKDVFRLTAEDKTKRQAALDAFEEPEYVIDPPTWDDPEIFEVIEREAIQNENNLEISN